MPTLKEILDSNSEVILDGCIRSSDFIFQIFTLKDYSYLSLRNTKSEFLKHQKFLEVLEHPNARTTSEITREIRTYAEKLGEKTSYLRDSSKDYKPKIKRLNRKRKIKRDRDLTDSFQTNSLKQELLESLQKRAFYAYQVSRRKELKIKDSDYQVFADLVIQLERVLHLKQDTGHLLGESDEDRSHYSDTDERVTATLLWQCMFSNKHPVLVTRDMDFIRMLGIFPGLLSSDIFLPYNDLFRKSMIRNSFRLYYPPLNTEDDYELYSCNPQKFYQKFKLNGLSEKENKEMENRVGDFWKQFSYSKTMTLNTTLLPQKSL